MATATASPKPAPRRAFLKISDAARMAAISASMLRSWERLGLLRPQRTSSGYRLYAQEDVRLLKRAVYLRRVRGLNARAILATLKSEGALGPTSGQAAGSMVALGARLRRERLRLRLSLSDVAGEVGVSVGFLSALERSQAGASVGTLRKLADFYGVSILSFFGGAHGDSPMVRPRDRRVLGAGPGVRMELLATGDTVMEPHLFRIAPGRGSGDAYSHQGEEFLFVLHGELEIALEGRSYRLKAGDSLYFDSTTPHRWFNPGKRNAEILWINTPPSF
jgi:DNA-binding transcriptional MerR regulator/mannose-6-phosphate isomerase-like protein (cupin superfamily)